MLGVDSHLETFRLGLIFVLLSCIPIRDDAGPERRIMRICTYLVQLVGRDLDGNAPPNLVMECCFTLPAGHVPILGRFDRRLGFASRRRRVSHTLRAFELWDVLIAVTSGCLTLGVLQVGPRCT